MRVRLLAACACLLLSVPSAPAQSARPGASQPASPAVPRALALDDYVAIRAVSDPAVSPDGSVVVYVVREVDQETDQRRASLWRARLAGGTPERLTFGDSSATHPRFSPDGRWIAFLSDRDEKSQVFLLPTAGGEAVRVTNLTGGVDDVEWAPDSRRLVIAAQDPEHDADTPKTTKKKAEPPIVVTRLQHKQDGVGYLDHRRTHLHVVTLADPVAPVGATTPGPKPLTSGDFDARDPAWSPDGTTIAFASNRTPDADANDNSDIWTIEVSTAALRQVTTDPGADGNPAWSPDGQTIAYVHMPVQPAVYATPRLMTIAAHGGTAKDLTGSLDRHVAGAPRWARDGRALLVTLVDRGHVPLVRISLDGRRTTLVDGEVEAFALAGPSVVCVAKAPTRPADVYVHPAEGGAGLNLSRANETLFSGLTVPVPEPIAYPSRDGTTIAGWILKPPGFDASKQYPLILRIHGGPVAQFTDGFFFENQYFASLGYVVLFVNPRGSNGYGEAFSKAIYADWGNKDVEDVMAGVDHVLARGYVDPAKLGVGGWSYGGILTNYVITKTDRFAGAISGASEADMYSAFGYDDLQRWWIGELGHPWDNLALYQRLSPVLNVKKVTTPTLVMCGEKDFRCPLPQSEQLYLSLKALGKTTALVIYPGQSHAIRKPSYEVDRLRRYGYWYDKFLLKKDVDPTYELAGEKKKTSS